MHYISIKASIFIAIYINVASGQNQRIATKVFEQNSLTKIVNVIVQGPGIEKWSCKMKLRNVQTLNAKQRCCIVINLFQYLNADASFHVKAVEKHLHYTNLLYQYVNMQNHSES